MTRTNKPEGRPMVALACVVIALGLWLVVSALANWEWYKQLTDFAVAETLFGENAARWSCGLSGVAVIGLGVAWLVRVTR